jgi:hypothetical protein
MAVPKMTYEIVEIFEQERSCCHVCRISRIHFWHLVDEVGKADFCREAGIRCCRYASACEQSQVNACGVLQGGTYVVPVCGHNSAITYNPEQVFRRQILASLGEGLNINFHAECALEETEKEPSLQKRKKFWIL